MHPLDGPRFKIRRAKSQIELLNREDDAFRAQADYRAIVAELNPKTGKYALRALVNVLPPPDLGVCIGEIAHNLRSALDGLVYQLAVLNGATGEALTRTQFPIFLIGRTTRQRKGKGKGSLISHFEEGGRNMIGALSREHQAVIEGLQPYKRGNLGKNNPLYILQELNNADKHRLLQVMGGKAVFYTVGVWGDGPEPDYSISLRAVFEDGAQVGRVAASDVHGRKVRMNKKITPMIAFWKGCRAVEGRSVPFVLGEIATKVDVIVESFRMEFR